MALITFFPSLLPGHFTWRVSFWEVERHLSYVASSKATLRCDDTVAAIKSLVAEPGWQETREQNDPCII